MSIQESDNTETETLVRFIQKRNIRFHHLFNIGHSALFSTWHQLATTLTWTIHSDLKNKYLQNAFLYLKINIFKTSFFTCIAEIKYLQNASQRSSITTGFTEHFKHLRSINHTFVQHLTDSVSQSYWTYE